MGNQIIREGSVIEWRWGDGKSKGRVKKVYYGRVEKQLKGSEVVRNGSKENPAYLIETDNGDDVVKLKSEIIGF